MVILQVAYSLDPGGAERFIIDLSNELYQQGHTVYLVVLRDDATGSFGFYKPQLASGVRYESLKIPIGFDLRNVYWLYRKIKQINPAIVHCHLNLVNYIFPTALISRGRKYFYTVHNDASTELTNKLELYLRKIYLKYLIFPITISKQTSISFEQCYGISEYEEIHYGRATPQFSEAFESTRLFFEKFRTAGKTIFLNIGRFHYQKNHVMLIKAFNRLIREQKQIALFIIGSGFSTVEGQQLKALAEPGIYFLHEKTNIHDFLSLSDAFCLSSVFEGLPLSLIESFAAGCVPICTPVGGIPGLVEEGKTGYLSASPSEDDYYAALQRYLSDKTLIKRESLVEIFQREYTIEICARRHIALYNRKSKHLDKGSQFR